jgi:hypothetical protein
MSSIMLIMLMMLHPTSQGADLQQQTCTMSFSLLNFIPVGPLAGFH